MGREFENDNLEKTRHHIIMFSDDITNINFLKKYESFLNEKEVYIQLNNTDSFLLGEYPSRVHFFNLYELIARIYWKEHNLLIPCTSGSKACSVAIIGYGQVGREICKYGIMNNIYDLNQEITYHIWGCEPHHRSFLESLNLMNNDVIVVHEGEPADEIDLLKMIDRIILTEEQSLSILQELLYRPGFQEIYYYDTGNMELSEIFKEKDKNEYMFKIHMFGDMNRVLNDECIKKESLLRIAKLLNYDYAVSYQDAHGTMEEEWSKWDGFKKGSNIARADYYWVIEKLSGMGYEREHLFEMEHIRWCRYHFINHWSFNEKRDDAKRRHNLLIPYSELPEKEKIKDGVATEWIRNEINNILNIEYESKNRPL